MMIFEVFESEDVAKECQRPSLNPSQSVRLPPERLKVTQPKLPARATTDDELPSERT